jgi:hypothetical protein
MRPCTRRARAAAAQTAAQPLLSQSRASLRREGTFLWYGWNQWLRLLTDEHRTAHNTAGRSTTAVAPAAAYACGTGAP